ncbi:MAG: hypothetical protein A2428_03185 [Bdellovibrionales bacterium RIFOXYC1_FULL_54_43]|nr:MAG: hypothetical protein A2428_03185 [Bdellovibrionales bacterium RIFOXYC1_FULL_54_43]OFZ82685.1 MAG: hypothetical protein A2603_02620 [Bdellovibrionales bacterium RIFOXYD1_FULL_55_31]
MAEIEKTSVSVAPGALELVILVLKIGLDLWTYFRGKAQARAEAARVIAERFTNLENQGYPIMRDILVEQGRSSWVDWSQVPALDTPPGGAQNAF